MNKEEIEELKDFTIDLTDIDELALGLEVCSKKSNMVIQEFANLIIELNQKYENAVADYETAMAEKEQLKKQLKDKTEDYKRMKDNFDSKVDVLTEIDTQQKEFINFLEDNYKETQDIWYIKILQKYRSIIGGKCES